jgi:hypothetical protein
MSEDKFNGKVISDDGFYHLGLDVLVSQREVINEDEICVKILEAISGDRHIAIGRSEFLSGKELSIGFAEWIKNTRVVAVLDEKNNVIGWQEFDIPVVLTTEELYEYFLESLK